MKNCYLGDSNIRGGGADNDFISSGGSLVVTLCKGPTETWTAPVGKPVRAQGPGWGIYEDAVSDSTFPVTVWDGMTYTAGAEGDIVDAGVGNDTIDGGAGDDTLVGGAGSDRLVFELIGAGPIARRWLRRIHRNERSRNRKCTTRMHRPPPTARRPVGLNQAAADILRTGGVL